MSTRRSAVLPYFSRAKKCKKNFSVTVRNLKNRNAILRNIRNSSLKEIWLFPHGCGGGGDVEKYSGLLPNIVVNFCQILRVFFFSLNFWQQGIVSFAKLPPNCYMSNIRKMKATKFLYFCRSDNVVLYNIQLSRSLNSTKLARSSRPFRRSNGLQNWSSADPLCFHRSRTSLSVSSLMVRRTETVL